MELTEDTSQQKFRGAAGLGGNSGERKGEMSPPGISKRVSVVVVGLLSQPLVSGSLCFTSRQMGWGDGSADKVGTEKASGAHRPTS